MKSFKAPRKALAGLDAETVSSLITASTDVALVLDAKGVVRDAAFGSETLAGEIGAGMVGKSWREAVTSESVPKIELLYSEAENPAARARQLNHPLAAGGTVPVTYTLRKLDGTGRFLAAGRDLRAVAALQQRLVEAEQSLERDYSRLRVAETRYRLLLQSVTEAVLIVDAATQKIVEANPAAAKLLGDASRKLVGRSFAESFDASGARLVGDWMSVLRTAGRAEELRVRLADRQRECVLVGVLFRQENVSNILVRMAPLGAAIAVDARSSGARLADVFQRLPDGLVVTDADGRIQTANRAFLDLVQIATEDLVRNESLDRWLGRPGVDLGVLVANLRQHGSVRMFATSLRGEYGSQAEVEISAVSLTERGETGIGFAIRNVERRRSSAGEARNARELPRSVEQLTELVGRVSLKELVRETTDVIERLCIEAALELTRDNRASAAEMLGLSRQSLYVKLRRHGLGDLEAGDGDEELAVVPPKGRGKGSRRR